MLNQQVQDRMSYFNKKYKRLTADYEELHQVIIEMRSHMSGTCVSSNWLYGPDDDEPPLSPPPTSSLF